jgi:hypothetical protein
VLPSAIVTTADGVALSRDALKVGDLIAVGGDHIGGEAGIGRRVVRIDQPFVPGATLTYRRLFANNGGDISGGLSTTTAWTGWLEIICSTDSINGHCTEVVASALGTEGQGLPSSEATKSISGSGVRPKGISGSGVRPKGISGSGVRPKGISGSGVRSKGISGSGVRPKGISGSGVRPKGISGSGVRPKGISGSGVRPKAPDDAQAH